MSNLVPYTPPSTQDIGLIESFRLRREERQANADLIRSTRSTAMDEVLAEQAAMRRANDIQRTHRLGVLTMALAEDRIHYAIDSGARVYDHAVEATNGDRGKALYLEPLLSRGIQQISDCI